MYDERDVVFDDIMDFLEDNIVEEIKEQKRTKKNGPTVFRDTLKKERTECDRDFVSKSELYDMMTEYQGYHISVLDGEELTDAGAKKFKDLREKMILKYYDIGKKLLNHSHFRKYPKDIKDDLLQSIFPRALAIGMPDRSNYGIEYWVRFDTTNFSNVFAFWTQQIKCFFYMELNEKNMFENTKWENLNNIVSQFDYDAKHIHGQPSARFHYGTVTDDD